MLAHWVQRLLVPKLLRDARNLLFRIYQLSREEDEGEATRAIDSNLDTRWIAFQRGAYIQADLGSSAILCSVDIAWYKGDARTYNFVISVSNNGQTFRDLVSGKSTGTTAMQERYNIPDTSARYLRVTVHGNSDNSVASIIELSINGRECSVPQISGVSAIGNDGNVPQNTLDNNLNTRWSNLGFPSWIQYDLGESQPICNVDIAWYRGNTQSKLHLQSLYQMMESISHLSSQDKVVVRRQDWNDIMFQTPWADI